jgi:hypothetical protein
MAGCTAAGWQPADRDHRAISGQQPERGRGAGSAGLVGSGSPASPADVDSGDPAAA